MALAKALETNVSYGIFQCYLHRSLMWHRSQGTPLRQILYADGKAPPSWSWMAYCGSSNENNETHHGEIQYYQMGHGDVEWDSNVQLVEALQNSKVKASNYVLEARVRRIQNCEIKPEGDIHGQEDNKVGHLYFDTQPGNAPPEVQCAIMGREDKYGVLVNYYGKRAYYVLLVTECATSPGRGESGKQFAGIIGSAQLQYRRIGMGWIQQRFIKFGGQDDTSQIV
jgi:hypothetical protein